MQLSFSKVDIRMLIVQASGGTIDIEDLNDSDNLVDVGYNSISMLNLIQELENTYGVFFDPDSDIEKLNSVNGIYSYLISQLS